MRVVLLMSLFLIYYSFCSRRLEEGIINYMRAYTHANTHEFIIITIIRTKEFKHLISLLEKGFRVLVLGFWVLGFGV